MCRSGRPWRCPGSGDLGRVPDGTLPAVGGREDVLLIRIQSVMASLRVHVEAGVFEWPDDFLAAGEVTLAFETLCDNFFEGECPIFLGELAELEALVEHMPKRLVYGRLPELKSDCW